MLARVLIPLLFFAAGPQFRLRDTQGGVHTAQEWAAHTAVVLFFVTIDCPIGNSYVPEMNRIRETYANRGVALYAVQADPSVREADVAKYAKDYGYTFPVLLDPGQILVRHVNATVTPQAAVLSPEGKLMYLGPIDNRVVDFGKSRPRATESYVRMILDATLDGHGITMAVPRSIGCSIPRKTQ